MKSQSQGQKRAFATTASILTIALAIAVSMPIAQASVAPEVRQVSIDPAVVNSSASGTCPHAAVTEDLGIKPDIVEADGIYDSQSPALPSEVIIGGRVQHTDPTRYDYVPSPSLCPVGAAPGIAPRDASGFKWIPAFPMTIKGVTIGIPKGQLSYSINGKGTLITAQGADYIVAGRPCNVRFEFQNRVGERILKSTSSPTYGCGAHFRYLDLQDRAVDRGLQCARLIVNGYFKGEHCHSIVP